MVIRDSKAERASREFDALSNLPVHSFNSTRYGASGLFT